MPYLNGVVTAGVAEATRVAQTVIHRGAEAGIVVIAGERTDRARADSIPEAAAGSRIARRPRRERRDEREGRRRQGAEQDPADEPTTGSLIDLQA
jgi:hypothetical protein